MEKTNAKVEWMLRKANTRPCAYIRNATLPPKRNPDITYIPDQAARFEIKKHAEDYARKLYDATGVAWEPIAALSVEIVEVVYNA